MALKDRNAMLFGEGGGGGGGWIFVQFCPCCSAFLKKKNGHFLTQKESIWQILADSKQLGKSLWNCHLGLACPEPFNYLDPA